MDMLFKLTELYYNSGQVHYVVKYGKIQECSVHEKNIETGP